MVDSFRAFRPDYFVSPGLVWQIVIPVGLFITGLVWLSPESIPCCLLGPVAHFLKYLGQTHSDVIGVTFIAAWLVHFGEGVYAFRMCRHLKMTWMTTLKWWLQSTILGIPSLILLVRYFKRHRKQHAK